MITKETAYDFQEPLKGLEYLERLQKDEKFTLKKLGCSFNSDWQIRDRNNETTLGFMFLNRHLFLYTSHTQNRDEQFNNDISTLQKIAEEFRIS